MDDLTGKMQALLSDPESMQQLSELAAMFQGGTSTPESAAPAPTDGSTGGFDPQLLMRLSQLMQSQQEPDQNTALLLALKPYLGQRRQYRTDKAIRLLRLYSLWKIARQTGMLNDLI
ncbi:MAG: hypothetical protein IJ906_03310 [Oscillospiraceae bacterium]|nr:hypothetical protein [Oscillospiraceae bacterium]